MRVVLMFRHYTPYQRLNEMPGKGCFLGTDLIIDGMEVEGSMVLIVIVDGKEYLLGCLWGGEEVVILEQLKTDSGEELVAMLEAKLLSEEVAFGEEDGGHEWRLYMLNCIKERPVNNI